MKHVLLTLLALFWVISASAFCGIGHAPNGSAKRTNSQLLTLQIYPNPVQHSATLEFQSMHNADETVMILDASGRPVTQWRPSVTTGVNSIALPTENLTPGMYYLWLEGSKERITLKFIVQ